MEAMKMARVVFINAETRKAEVRDIPDDYKAIQHALGCDMYGIIGRKIGEGRKIFDIYHDDEFLYKQRTCQRTGVCCNYDEELYESIFVARHTPSGAIKSLTDEEVQQVMDNIVGGVLLYKL